MTNSRKDIMEERLEEEENRRVEIENVYLKKELDKEYFIASGFLETFFGKPEPQDLSIPIRTLASLLRDYKK